MAQTHRRVKVLAFAGGILALAAWLLPAYFSTESYRRRLETALETVLHRPVTFAAASFRLLPRPGFTLQNVVVQDDPGFGPEPFARIDRVECDLRWSSLWRRKLDFARLKLARPSFNLAREGRREWNFETFLAKSGVTAARGGAAEAEVQPPFVIEAEDARINFKTGYHKKPFAIVGLRARLTFDPIRRRILFNVDGTPVRTDLSFGPPGTLEVAGEWSPGLDLNGSFDATLRTRGALLYNWIPLLTGSNPAIYGAIDADARVRGSLRTVRIEGEATVSHLHRWEMLPPADPMPVHLRYRGSYDGTQGRAVIESVEASFSNSNIHLTGAVDRLQQEPEFDLVVAIERSRLEDWTGVMHRLWRFPDAVKVTGRVDGLLTIQSHGAEMHYGGFLGGREVRLVTLSGEFPLSNPALRVDRNGVRLDPVVLNIGPQLALGIEGGVPFTGPTPDGKVANEPPQYELKITAKSVSLGEAIRFARSLGIAGAARVDVEGTGNASALLTGTAWPLAKPHVAVKGDVRAARLLVPGLTEPLNVPRARLQVEGSRVVLDSITAVIGSSILKGRVEYQGSSQNPWLFDVTADALSVEQGSAWFDALGHRPPLPLLERIPGLGSNSARRSAASGLFTTAKVQGRFTTPLLTYRSLRLLDFQASLELSGRILQLTKVAFHAGKGSGAGNARVDLNDSPARISGQVTMAGLKIQSLAGRIPVALRKTRGTLSGTVNFRTRGLSRSEMSANLEAEGKALLERVQLGDFDPLGPFARQANWAPGKRSSRELSMKPAEVSFEIRDKRVTVVDQPLEIEGAKLNLSGNWVFNGPLDLEVVADLREVNREWNVARTRDPGLPTATLHLMGPLENPEVHPSMPARMASREKVQ